MLGIISETKKICEDCAIPVNVSNEIHSLRSSQNPEESSDDMQARVQAEIDAFLDDVRS